MWQCSQQHENREEAKFCAKCGEKRDTRVYCTECGTLLEADDLFCTSCGYRRDPEMQAVSKPDRAFSIPVIPAPVIPTPVVLTPVISPPVAPTPVEQPVVVPVQTAPVTGSSKAPELAEPVSFRFGGALIPMGGEAQRQEQVGRPTVVAGPTGARSGGMSSTQSAILGFVAIVVVLGIVFYLVGR